MASKDQHSNDTPRSDISQLFSVDGLVAVITGGGTGIGLIMATALEHNGATVYIIGRRRDVLEKAAKDNNKHGKIIPLEGDITDHSRLQAIVEIIKAQTGHIDLLVNNAGLARNFFPHPLPVPTPETPSIEGFQTALWNAGTPEDFAATLNTCVTAVYYTTVAFLGLLHEGNAKKRMRGKDASPPQLPGDLVPPPPYVSSQVITVSSSGAFRIDSKVLSPSYTVAKCAVTNLGKLFANLLAPWGIRSNVLAPGVWPTEMTTNPEPGITLSPETLASVVPLRRVGTYEGMAGTILYLASRAGAYADGAVWLVDGGRVCSLPNTYGPSISPL